jgi:hypothetical protein
MRMIRTLVLATAAGLVATAASAQQAPTPFILATYYRCDYVRQARADTLYRQFIAPALDRQIKAGNLTGYGFSSHRMGGVFRRLESWTAPSLEKLLAAQDAYQADMEKTNPKAYAEFDTICGSHDDYIWNRMAGSTTTPSAAASAVSYSRYYGCSEEGIADMVMENVYAEIMNKHLAAGHISGWMWLNHNMGGPIRRVLNWSAPDVLSLLKAEEMISGDMANNGAWGNFSQACNTHSDYVWQSEARNAP